MSQPGAQGPDGTGRAASRGSLMGPAARSSLVVPVVNVEGSSDVVSRTSLTQPEGVKLKMPATQAAKLTKAYNQLMSLKAAGGVEAVVLQQLAMVRKELTTLQDQCALVQPIGREQAEFKEVWMRKYLRSKELFLERWDAEQEHGRGPEEDELPKDAGSVRSSSRACRSNASVTSSVRRAAIQAEEEQARLELKLQQLTQQQKQQRQQQERRRLERLRQEEEDALMAEQKERQEIEQQLEGVRARRQALSRAASEGTRTSHVDQHEVEVPEPAPQHQGGEQHEQGAPQPWHQLRPEATPWRPEGPEALPAVQRPVETWLGGQPLGGGFVNVTTPGPGCRLSPQDQLLQHVILAQAKLPIFKGDPLEFLWFVSAFEAQVTSVTSDPARRLYLLLQQLQGQPYDMVKGCQLMDPELGYARAMKKLRERYGHPVRQAMAFRSKLLAWPSLRNASHQELEGFNTQLQLCQDVKLAGNGLAELDSPATLLQLAAKLPNKLQLGWQTKAFDVENNEHREAGFDDFVRFVDRQVGLRCHPVYSKLTQGRVGKAIKEETVKATVVSSNDEPTVAATDVRGNSDKTKPLKSASGGPQSGVPMVKDGTRESSNADEDGKTDKQDAPNAFKPPCLLCAGRHATSECTNTQMSKKERYEKLQGLCFACLNPGHLARQCRTRAQCTRCEGKHPTILHSADKAKENEPADPEREAKVKATVSVERTLATKGAETYAVATVPVRVWHSSKKSIVVHAVLDPASTATFVTATVIQQLGIKAHAASIGVTTIANHGQMPVSMVQGLKVGDMEDNCEFAINTAYAVNELPFARKPTIDEISCWPHLHNVPFHWAPKAPIAMLIGLNVAGALRPEQVIHGEPQEPYAVRTPLGWAVHGSLERHQNPPPTAKVLWTKTDDIAQCLQQLHYKDFDQAFEFGEKGPSQDDLEWQRLVNTSVQRVPQRLESSKPNVHETHQYCISLPFRHHAEVNLQNNVEQAQQRMASIQRKFRRNPQFEQDYRDFMNKMISNGYVEEVSDEGKGKASLISYVIHHGVYHPRKPGKIRVVFNCASKFKGWALNDCLLPGPDLTNSLVGVLLRFRQYKVAFMADIESMFYRVQVPAEQRDVLRFLWWKEGKGEALTTYRLKVHLFGATSSPSIANFALRKAAKDAQIDGHVTEQTRIAVEKNFYVDDCLKSMRTEQEAVDMAHELVRACAYGGFRLTKFVSTSPNLLKSFKQEELAKNLEMVDLNDDKGNPLGAAKERALGVMWSLDKDQFEFKVASEKQEQVTKRSVLSSLSAVYDPLGIAAPVIIVARVLFRELTKSDLGWDDTMEEKHRTQWSEWQECLSQLQSVSMARCLIPENGPVELHTFCDASMEAYAAVAYLKQGSHVRFVIGKARVSPPKVTTIPRLELTAAKLAAELANVVTKELQEPITKRVFWSDSTTVLKYLRNETKRFHVFVANRVCTILNASKASEWRYVPTTANPADDATRGLDANKLQNSAWLRGPTFLTKPEMEWPSDPEVELDETDVEVRRSEWVACTEQAESVVEKLSTWYSSANKVRRAVAIWIRLMRALRSKDTKAERKPQVVGLHELKEAENAAIAALQQETWPTEIGLLSRNELVPKASPLHTLNPGLVQYRPEGCQRALGLVLVVMRTRVGGNIPIIPYGMFAERLVQEAHHEQGHQGRASTAAAILRKYWIIRLNKIVRKVVRECPGCQRRKTRPQSTAMAPLPDFRCNPRSPQAFEVTGVDYFGPFYTKRGRARVKAYGVIFTCAVTRAVHLEVAEDLSSSSFINALRRFTARRGHVRKFVSDNGTNFVGAKSALHNELQKELKHLKQEASERVAQELRLKGIEWSFSPPAASHHGGFWERLIRSVRRILEVFMERRLMSYEALVTWMCEAEAIMNNRPLTTISTDPDDLEPLTPNHLLWNKGSDVDTNVAPPGDYDQTAFALQEQWKRVQNAANDFWRRWMTEYRVLLHQRTKWHRPTTRRLQVNDPVLVLDPLLPRDQWKLGRITAVHRSDKDGDIRVVDVKTKNGVLTRPITKVCLLETASENP